MSSSVRLLVLLVAFSWSTSTSALSLVLSVRSNVNLIQGELQNVAVADGLTGTVEINADRFGASGGPCTAFCVPGNILIQDFRVDLGTHEVTVRLDGAFVGSLPITSSVLSAPRWAVPGQIVTVQIGGPSLAPPSGPEYLYMQRFDVTVPTLTGITTDYALEAIRAGMIGTFARLRPNEPDLEDEELLIIGMWVESATYVPEPSVALLLGLGLAGLGIGRRARHVAHTTTGGFELVSKGESI